MKVEAMSFDDYASPPVTEVALSVQFKPLQLLRTPYIGFLWKKYQGKGLSNVQEHPPLEPAFELFKGDRLKGQVIMTNIPPIPRVWFLNETETELVQVQHDRLVHNWRRLSPSEGYPRYPTIRAAFLEDLRIFADFLKEHELGEVEPNQCEITYVNPIPFEEHNFTINDIHEVFTVLNPDERGKFLPALDSFNLALSYLIPKEDGCPMGRFYISVRPAMSKDGRQNVFLLELTARGKPKRADLDGIMEFIDEGHKWIVKGFTSITSDSMHEIWGLRK